MSESTTQKQISLSGWRYQNWKFDAEPPVIFNEAASTHNCVAWCWGEIQEAHQLAIIAQMGGEDVGLPQLIDAIQTRLMAVEQVLNILSVRTLEEVERGRR